MRAVWKVRLTGQTYEHIVFPAPGGTLSDDVTCTDVCLFKAQEDMETMQAYAQVKTT